MNRKEAERAVRDAGIVGILAVGITIALTLIYASGAGIAHVDLWNVLDIVILSGLTWAIFSRYRYSAALMLVYYLAGKMVFWWNEQAFIGLPIALIFAYFFWRGDRGLAALANDAIETGQPIPVKQS